MSAPWLTVARTLEGEAEVKGSVDNPRIVEMFRVAGHAEIKDDETAWCAAFVGTCLRLSGYEPSFSLLASSYRSHLRLDGLAGTDLGTARGSVGGALDVAQRIGNSAVADAGRAA